MVYTLRGKALAQKVHAECSQEQKIIQLIFNISLILGILLILYLLCTVSIH